MEKIALYSKQAPLCCCKKLQSCDECLLQEKYVKKGAVAAYMNILLYSEKSLLLLSKKLLESEISSLLLSKKSRCITSRLLYAAAKIAVQQLVFAAGTI
jgi:hypothetical protein